MNKYAEILLKAFTGRSAKAEIRKISQRYQNQTDEQAEKAKAAAQARREHRMKRVQGWSGHGQ